MKFKKILTAIYLCALGFLTLEILFRRLVWHQVPTQVPAWFVYGLLVLNGFVVLQLMWRSLGYWGSSTKKGKS